MATRTAAKKSPATAKKSPAKTAAKKAPAKKTTRRQKDACDLLDADHKAVKQMFEDYKKLAESRSRSPNKRRELADKICMELTVHAQIEEEIFYPAARGAIKDNPLLNEATVEHASAKELIAQIKSMDVGDDLFDAKVIVLGEYIEHHVKEERTEMFPKVRKTRLDLIGMRDELESRKEVLMSEMQSAPALLDATPA